jgi:[ribosomal protein S5]-alanine N-acetyltransferase
MIIDTEMKNCRLRPWRPEDKCDLQRNGNNRKVWLNLTDMFPSPYTAADADF